MKPAEPIWNSEIIGFSHHLAICYLLIFSLFTCQDKSVNINRTRAVRQRSGVFFLDMKFIESLGLFSNIYRLLTTMRWILSKLELITACLKANPASQKGAGCAIVLHEEKRTAAECHVQREKKNRNISVKQNRSLGERFSKERERE